MREYALSVGLALSFLLVSGTHRVPGSEAGLYVRESTFEATMLGVKNRLAEYAEATGFHPHINGFMRRTTGTRKISIDISALDRICLVAHHTVAKANVPALWGNAVLIDEDGRKTPLASLKPISVAARNNAFVRYDNKPFSMGKTRFEHGIQAVTPAEIIYRTDRRYVRFETDIGIQPNASHGLRVRFKILDRPNAEDLHDRLWDRIAADFPGETSLFGQDGDYWLGNDRPLGFESRLISKVAGQLGKRGQGLSKQLKAISPLSSSTPEDRMKLLARACRFQIFNNVMERFRSGMTREILLRAPRASEELLVRLDRVEAGLALLGQAMRHCDEDALREAHSVVGEGQAVLREAIAEQTGVGRIVFTVRNPGRDGHWYANFGYWCSDPSRKIYAPGGSRLAILDLLTGEVTNLLTDPEGAFRDPQVNYDGTTMVFSWRKGGTEHYKLYEINVDGTGLRQLTSGPFDDIEPTYIPGGDIVFCSSRCNRWVNCFYTQVAILYRCGPDGQNVHPISSNIEHDNTPWPLPDGRLLYTRWEYVDRSQMAFHHLWTVNPDGTGQMAYYGNQHPGRVFIDAKPIPGTNKILASFCPGHGRREHAGAVTVVTPDLGPDELSSETSINDSPVFRDPYPLSEKLFLVARENQLLVMDDQGLTQELYCAEKYINEPRPIASRNPEHVLPKRTNWGEDHGRLILQNVRVGRNMEGVKNGEIKKLLVMESLPKPVNHSGGMDIISHLGTFTLERVLGTVPVEPDGSANFLIPANRPVFFVTLNENDLSVKRMQSFVSVLPGETTSCLGCHESRVRVPTAQKRPVLDALRRPPSNIAPFEGLPDVIDFPRHVQPILDKHCVRCHNYKKRSGKTVLVNDYGARLGTKRFTQGYWTLLLRGQFADGANKYGNRAPYTVGSGASPLMKKILTKHHGVTLSDKERRLMWMWMETGAAYAGTYAALMTTKGPTVHSSARAAIFRRCQSCHNEPGMRLLTNPRGIKSHHYREIPKEAERFAAPLLFNVSNPRNSLVLLAPLAKKAGGYGICPENVFADKKDPDYIRLLAAMDAPHKYLKTAVLYHMTGFKPNIHYVREMKRYGVLAKSFDPDKDEIDVYETDEAYWQSMWHQPSGRQ